MWTRPLPNTSQFRLRKHSSTHRAINKSKHFPLHSFRQTFPVTCWLQMSRWLSQAVPRRVIHLSSCQYLTRQHEIRVFYLPFVPSSPMSTSAFEYGYIEGVERLEDYRPGGYHPIQIDDRLHRRYRIVHKLGHGTFSTAWLALDEDTSKYVAIKVGSADAYRREVDVLSRLASGVAACNHDADKASMIPSAIDRFSIDGPNGTHPCLVTVPARCSLMDAKEASDPRLFQLDVARFLAAQLVMAVSLVHSQGYAHGGACSSVSRFFL